MGIRLEIDAHDIGFMAFDCIFWEHHIDSMEVSWISGWWFGTFFFHSVGIVIIPTDELHHFSEG
jgi:hypothetical protein